MSSSRPCGPKVLADRLRIGVAVVELLPDLGVDAVRVADERIAEHAAHAELRRGARPPGDAAVGVMIVERARGGEIERVAVRADRDALERPFLLREGLAGRPGEAVGRVVVIGAEGQEGDQAVGEGEGIGAVGRIEAGDPVDVVLGELVAVLARGDPVAGRIDGARREMDYEVVDMVAVAAANRIADIEVRQHRRRLAGGVVADLRNLRAVAEIDDVVDGIEFEIEDIVVAERVPCRRA